VKARDPRFNKKTTKSTMDSSLAQRFTNEPRLASVNCRLRALQQLLLNYLGTEYLGTAPRPYLATLHRLPVASLVFF
jgi:hypothetical protein